MNDEILKFVQYCIANREYIKKLFSDLNIGHYTVPNTNFGLRVYESEIAFSSDFLVYILVDFSRDFKSTECSYFTTIGSVVPVLKYYPTVTFRTPDNTFINIPSTEEEMFQYQLQFNDYRYLELVNLFYCNNINYHVRLCKNDALTFESFYDIITKLEELRNEICS